MKTLIQHSGCIAMVLVVVTMLPTRAQQHLTDTIRFENEPKIDLTNFIRTYPEVKPEKADFQKFFRLASGKQVQKVTDSIPAYALVSQLYEQARTRMEADPTCRNKRCVTGVKISYGLEGENIKFYYQPLYMVRIAANKDSFAIENYDSQNFYSFNQKQGAFVQDRSVVRDTTEYQDKVMVKRKPGNPAFEKRDKFDADAIIFSFQEILRFYRMVNWEEPSTRPYYSTHLLVHSASAKYPHPRRNSSGKSAKHTIFMTKFNWSEQLKSGVVSIKVLVPGPGANLAHLCPPSCTVVNYPTEPE